MFDSPNFKMPWIDLQPFIDEFNFEKQMEFKSRGNGRRNYTIEQKSYAIYLIEEHGIRGVSRILGLPRRTLQRWCRRYDIKVKRCPDWVYERAERWKKRKRRYG